MKVEQGRWTDLNGWWPIPPGELKDQADLVLIFGSTKNIQKESLLKEVQAAYPQAVLFGCTTAGEIFDMQVVEDSLSIAAVQFEKTEIEISCISIREVDQSFKVGKELAHSLSPEGLAHVFVLSDGVYVNGSELVNGLINGLPEGVKVTGGLAGDGDRFQETRVICNGAAQERRIAAIGFYGDQIKVGYGSMGGWDPFGPYRLVTKSSNNILYELDNRKALELYKLYLGEFASGLPATGLLFPLSIYAEYGDTGIVRTILGVNEDDQSLIFAGDIPEGSYARFMKANADRLIDGAAGAAKINDSMLNGFAPDLAILISCVGRKMVLKQRTEEELEAVRDIFGNSTILTGFYSYGEISPFRPDEKSELHNQTMTITTLMENL